MGKTVVLGKMGYARTRGVFQLAAGKELRLELNAASWDPGWDSSLSPYCRLYMSKCEVRLC